LLVVVAVLGRVDEPRGGVCFEEEKPNGDGKEQKSEEQAGAGVEFPKAFIINGVFMITGLAGAGVRNRPGVWGDGLVDSCSSAYDQRPSNGIAPDGQASDKQQHHPPYPRQ